MEISLLLWQILLIDLHFCGSKGNGTVRVSMCIDEGESLPRNELNAKFFKLWLKDF